MHHAAVEVLLLLLVGCVVGLTARRFKLPYTLALVVAGIALGFVDPHQIQAFELNAALLFTFLLPALLFEAALHLDIRDFMRNAWPITMLAIPGVMVATVATSAVLYALIGATGLNPAFGWTEALLFGSVISATDPISVLALFKELGVQRRLYLLVEGESLLNDGVAVVLFLIVAAVAGVEVGEHAHPHLAGWGDIAVFGIRTFIWMGGGGVLIGLMVGGLASVALRYFEDHLIETTITTIVAYGSFMAAEAIGCSGVLSTVTAGVITGSYGTLHGMSTRTRLAVNDFWEYAAFLANTLVFLLVGIELQVGPLVADIVPVALGVVATLMGRGLAVYLGGPLCGIPRSWSHVLWWGGLRGSLSMVLILGLPHDFQGRDVLIHMVFGAVSASLFLQGLTMAPLLRRLGLSQEKSERALSREVHRAELVAIVRAQKELEHLEHEGLVSAPVAERLRGWYDQRRDEARTSLKEVVIGADELAAQELLEAVLRLTDVEREAIRHATHADAVGVEAAERALMPIDDRTASLRDALHHGEVRDVVERVLTGAPPHP
ncbi:MAG: sodium:proton antiporter [Myxococcales bacterium]|nr:sodium:proton antiporter [Myxococcales bacterium]